MKKPTNKQLDRLARRIFEDCVPMVKKKHPADWVTDWDSMGSYTRCGWIAVAKWHLEHKDK